MNNNAARLAPRAERRNERFGRKHAGNTTPSERALLHNVNRDVLAGLRDRIFSAAEVLRRMPDRERVWLSSGERAAWPTIILGYWEAYGQHRARVRLSPPSASQIT